MATKKYDFSGWATRNDIQCSDGRIIRRDAFKECDGQTVPLVWNHTHDDPFNVLGHALLENRQDGVYAYCTLNDTEQGRNAKLLVEHGDISALSIYANRLKQTGPNVTHGAIREVSLVLAGANPEAFIDSVITHSEDFQREVLEDDAVIYSGDDIILGHSDIDEPEGISEDAEEETEEHDEPDDIEHADKEGSVPTTTKKDKTVQDVIDGMTEEERAVMYYVVGQALEDGSDDTDDSTDEEGNDRMKHNVFDRTEEEQGNVISHSELNAVVGDIKRAGSLKEAALAHGIDDIDYLFPEAKSITNVPEFIKRDQGWVSIVMNGIHHTPFSRVKSVFADITEDEARARGYIKGKLKKEEVFGLLKRVTTPTTVYKKQKFDRDDIKDITDFDVVAWVKTEMRMMLDEEIARAVLFGDGRLASDDDKVNELNIRPVWTDDDLFTVKTSFVRSSDGDQQTQDDANARAFIRAAIKSRKDYKGSGNPVMFMTQDMLTNCLLLEDKMGRVIYDTEEKLRTALRVSQIVTPEVMDDLTRTATGKTYKLEGLYLNLADYNSGTDHGGQIDMFDDFDIDYNQQKYLIEVRMSGAMIKPFGAVAIESTATA